MEAMLAPRNVEDAMAPKYDDPAYIAARNWQCVEEWVKPAERTTLLAKLGFDEQDARTDRCKSLALLSAWRCAFAVRVRRTFRSEMPQGVAGTVVRTLELVLELNLGRSDPARTVPVRVRFGFKQPGRWCCQLYADANTDPARPWLVAWRFPYVYCFVHADAAGQALDWADGFTDSPTEDARRFRLSVPTIDTIWMQFDARYCLWLEGLLAQSRLGAIPAFYWPGYDGAPLTATRLFGPHPGSYPLPRSPWG